MGFAREQKVVDAAMIEEAARDLDMLEHVSEGDSQDGSSSHANIRSRAKGIFKLFR